MNPNGRRNGLTRWEATSGVVVIMVCLLLLNLITFPAGRSSMVPHASHLRNAGEQLFRAAWNMAQDYEPGENEACGWAGELAVRKETAQIVTVKAYLSRLVTLGYLDQDQLSQLLRAPGVQTWNGTPETFDARLNCPFKFYRATRADSASNLFLATRNFSYGSRVDRTLPPIINGQWYPMGGGGAIGGGHRYPVLIVHMDGSARVYADTQLPGTKEIGLLPGRASWSPADRETPADSLVQE